MNHVVDLSRECVDQPHLANCDLILQAQLCGNEYYSSFCCASCARYQQQASPPRHRGWQTPPRPHESTGDRLQDWKSELCPFTAWNCSGSSALPESSRGWTEQSVVGVTVQNWETHHPQVYCRLLSPPVCLAVANPSLHLRVVAVIHRTRWHWDRKDAVTLEKADNHHEKWGDPVLHTSTREKCS